MAEARFSKKKGRDPAIDYLNSKIRIGYFIYKDQKIPIDELSDIQLFRKANYVSKQEDAGRTRPVYNDETRGHRGGDKRKIRYFPDQNHIPEQWSVGYIAPIKKSQNPKNLTLQDIQNCLLTMQDNLLEKEIELQPKDTIRIAFHVQGYYESSQSFLWRSASAELEAINQLFFWATRKRVGDPNRPPSKLFSKQPDPLDIAITLFNEAYDFTRVIGMSLAVGRRGKPKDLE
jgi:hypothetical protein